MGDAPTEFKLPVLRAIFEEVGLERMHQDTKWGGPVHDDQHALGDWIDFIDEQQARAFEPHEGRERLIKIAALAVAAVQSLDRKRIRTALWQGEEWPTDVQPVAGVSEAPRLAEASDLRAPGWRTGVVMPLPKIVCLCGSTKFWKVFAEEGLRLTLEGHIVLDGAPGPAASEIAHSTLAEGRRLHAQMEVLHFRKIDLADEILVLNVGGYIGESTEREIIYAESTGKVVRYLDPANAPV